uniref:Uncharacterized protein n=1 Tax=Arundo donax TaxID=35708 RepID=A0A0A8YGZ7_ARUDO
MQFMLYHGHRPQHSSNTRRMVKSFTILMPLWMTFTTLLPPRSKICRRVVPTSYTKRKFHQLILT